MHKMKVTLLAIVAVSLLISCGLFNDDDSKEFLTSKTWILEKYLRNGNDHINSINISNYKEKYYANGVFDRSYFDNIDDKLVEESGQWEFKNNEKELHVTGISSIRNFSNNNSTLSSSLFLVNKLTEDNFNYNYENGGDNHEFRFIPE